MKVGMWQEDMKFIATALAEAQVPAPLFAATVSVYNAAMGLGYREEDTAAVFDVLSGMSSSALMPIRVLSHTELLLWRQTTSPHN